AEPHRHEVQPRDDDDHRERRDRQPISAAPVHRPNARPRAAERAAHATRLRAAYAIAATPTSSNAVAAGKMPKTSRLTMMAPSPGPTMKPRFSGRYAKVMTR